MNIDKLAIAYIREEHPTAPEMLVETIESMSEAYIEEVYERVIDAVRELSQSWDFTDVDEELVGSQIYYYLKGKSSIFDESVTA